LTPAKQTLFSFFAILVAAVIFGSHSLLYPYGRDQSVYAYVAQVILDGGVPYKDVFHFKPPAVDFLCALSFLLFGKQMIGIRIFDLLWQTITALFICAITNKVFRSKYGGTISAVIYLFIYYSNNFWHTAQSDGFLSLPLTLSILFCLVAMEKRGFFSWGCVGFILSLAFLFKYSVGILLPIMLGIALWYKGSLVDSNAAAKTESFKSRILKAMSLVCGFFIPIAACILYFYINNGLREFIFMEFILAPKYTRLAFQNRSLFEIIKDGASFLINFFPVFIGISISIFLFIVTTKWISDKILIISAWLLSSFFSLILQGKFFPYQYLPLVAPLAIMFSISIYSFYEERKLFRGKVLLIISILLFLIPSSITAQQYLVRMKSFFAVVSGRTSIENNYNRFGWGDVSLRDEIDVAHYISENSSPQEKVYVWGFEPIIYVLAERKCVSRIITNNFLYSSWAEPKHKEEFLRTIYKEIPIYFIVVKNDEIPWVTGTPDDSQKAFKKFKELYQFISEKYTIDKEIGDFVIYRSKQ